MHDTRLSCNPFSCRYPPLVVLYYQSGGVGYGGCSGPLSGRMGVPADSFFVAWDGVCGGGDSEALGFGGAFLRRIDRARVVFRRSAEYIGKRTPQPGTRAA